MTAGGRATFRLLGPVAVLDPAGTSLPVGGPRRRALLAALLLHPGTSLPVERLVGMLWPDPPPPTASTMVHGAVAAIRRVLEPDAPHVLVTRDGGYVLEVPPEWVDAARFERALEAGRRLLATSPQRASSLLAEALAEWRGPALAGVEEPFARAAAARLDELRLRCYELHADAELRLDRHSTVVARLEELAAAHPLREELCAHLIVALYRCGRQADALAAYRRLRATLVGELGVEPGERLRGLELAVLRHDQRLQPVRAGGAALPAPLGSFVGRDGELDELPALVRSDRLVTLTGPGGAGKTRLALEVARRLTDVDTYVVELAPLPTSALVAETLADALGIRAEPGHGLVRTIAAALSFASGRRRARQLRAPRLGLRRTRPGPAGRGGRAACACDQPGAARGSRRACPPRSPAAFGRGGRELGAHRGERRGAPVRRPGGGRPPGLHGHRRQRRAGRRGVPPPRRRCRWRSSSLRRALRRSRWRSSSTGSMTGSRCWSRPRRAVDPRHRSLAAALAWGHDLLPAAERALFARLAVFPAGFDLAAARAVCGGPSDVALPLARLVASSMVHLDDQPDGGARYRLLESVRAYAGELLDEPTRADLADRHAAHYLALAQEAQPRLFAAGSGPWLERLHAERDNLRAALAWCFDADPERGVRLVRCLWHYWDLRGARDEGLHWVHTALAAVGPDRPEQRVPLLSAGALLHLGRADLEETVRLATEQLALSLPRGARRWEGDALAMLATVDWARGRFDRAQQRYEDAIEACLAGGDMWNAALAESPARPIAPRPAGARRRSSGRAAVAGARGGRRRGRSAGARPRRARVARVPVGRRRRGRPARR